MTDVPTPILVTGCGRSGSSMIAGVLNICGAFVGNVGGENKNFENVKVRESLIVPYLRSLNVDTLCQFPLPNVDNMPIPVNWKTNIIDIMQADGYKSGPWLCKGASLCLTWPVWNYAFPNAKWLIVRRRTGDIISSCLKTDFMRAFRSKQVRGAISVDSERDGWLWWVHQHEKRFVEMIMEGLNCRVIWPERMVYGDYEQMYETIDWLGLKWKTDVLAFIDPKFWKVRRQLDVKKSSVS